MRTLFDEKSLSVLNRVYNAVLGLPNQDPMMPYQGFDHRLAHLLWYEADRLCDYGGETDAIMDTYPNLKAAWDKMMDNYPNASDEAMTHQDNVGDAENIALDFENRLYIAMVVVNAYKALEGSPFLGITGSGDSCWTEDNLKKINAEFHEDRKRIGERIDNILAIPTS